MDSVGPILFAILAIVAVAVIAGFSYWYEKKRREAFRGLAQRLELRFRSHKDRRGIPREYHLLDALRQGDNRYAFNVLEGDYRGHPVKVFDYHYETYSTDSKGNRQTHHHHFSYFILSQSNHFPELRIYPENWLSKIGQAVGYDDIDFESIEFSKAFTVRSKDKKFAYDICHTGMMEYLLDHRDLKIEIEGFVVALGFDSRLKAEEVETHLGNLVRIRGLFPEYLYQTS